jgi:Ca2+/H+ antiporter
MSRWAFVDWKRVAFGVAVIGLAAYVGFVWQRPRHDDNERFVQSNYQRDSGQWHRKEVTGAELNQLADDAQPLNRVVSAVLMLAGVAIIAFELRHFRK